MKNFYQKNQSIFLLICIAGLALGLAMAGIIWKPAAAAEWANWSQTGSWIASNIPQAMQTGGTTKKYFNLSGDFNGDGFPDIASISPNANPNWQNWIAMGIHNNSGGFTGAYWGCSLPQHMRNGGSSSNYYVLTGDFNGDGRTDIAAISPNAGGSWNNRVFLELSTGTGFTDAVWTTPIPTAMHNYGPNSIYYVLTGDYNGDGRTDIAVASPNAGGNWGNWIATMISTGSSFTSGYWGCALPQHMRNGGSTKNYNVQTGDFNGDGKTDIAAVSPNATGAWNDRLYMELSTGSGFTDGVWLATLPQHMRNGGSSSNYIVKTGDFNNDDMTDIATVSPNAAGAWNSWIYMELSTGSGFSHVGWTAALPQHMRNGGSSSNYIVKTGDFNNDDMTDIATVSPNAAGAWGSNVRVTLSTGSGFLDSWWKADLPGHMRNGLSSNYTVLANDYDDDGVTDLLTLSSNADGAWRSNIRLESSAPVIIFQDNAAGSGVPKAVQGSQIISQYIPNIEEMMRQVSYDVRSTIYYSPGSGEPIKPFVGDITLELSSWPGNVAHFDYTPRILKLSAEFVVDQYNSYGASMIAWSIQGVLAHEITHDYQYQPLPYDSPDNHGFVEGLADYVRIQLGLHNAQRVHGGNWNDGYTTTGYFIKWLVDTKDSNFARKLNGTVKDSGATWDWDTACNAILGQSVQTLWDQYQASF